MYDQELCHFAQELEQQVKKFQEREHKEPDNERSVDRDEYRRDYARVLYCSSFRRLQGKMQLLGIDPTNFYRNRLTHSLEVAQIAGSIARDLGLKAPIVTETCSLAHDLGNPPFGHAGERVLNELSQDVGCYEGNAQTFRILRHLEKKSYAFSGLNLTLRTLLGVTKYFYRKNHNPKKFLYNEDYDFLQNQMDEKNTYIQKSIDVQIMDLADEIAYAAHDLEDAISFGLVSLAEIMHEFSISSEYQSASESFNQIAQKSREVAMRATRLDTSEEYSFLIRKELTSNIVYTLMCDIGITEHEGSIKLGYKSLSKLAEGLKKLVFKALLRKKDVQLYEKQGERIIKGLFEVYTDSNFNRSLLLLPPEFRALANEKPNDEKTRKRVVVDYIAGMMDSFAVQEYQRYFGSSSLDNIYERHIYKVV
ncbi:dGTP triphosphohydrolase [Aliterella atlantica]|uniref:Deoxyguanosinetriphosphate triphosphohydrolase-like protein n=1 Tax=Aliterella atlantica CENA595 TaxID=1618023 RepID=A0A0D8ZNA5_9CYAN|nr:dNTP triphosphohydrolase [Aliterella atlantica]KJH70225.1 deoxyguanosinetriphosphate triphosphohydrolase [Aliterella atlantica CENA595]